MFRLFNNNDNELYRFKRVINLVDYAASLGYRIDRQKSSKSCIIMRKDYAKIGISTALSGDGVFYDFRKDKGGTIIDFVKFEKGKNLGQVRQELRPWIGLSYPSSEYPKPLKSSKSRQKVTLEFAKAKSLISHKYIEGRGINEYIIKSERFLGKIYSDNYGNAIFPHYDHDGICGFSIINQSYKGFSKDGEKGLWFSNFKRDDKRMIICESAIDALSYHQLKGDSSTCYFAIDGQLTKKQLMLIDILISKNQNKEIILAFDNDHAGQKYASLIREQCKDLLHPVVDLPEKDGQDWNDVLKEQRGVQF